MARHDFFIPNSVKPQSSMAGSHDPRNVPPGGARESFRLGREKIVAIYN